MFDFADVLLDVLNLKASDLHLTAGSPPMVREKGRLRALDYPVMTPQMTRETIYSILTNDQRKRPENDWQIDFAYSIPGKARFTSCGTKSFEQSFTSCGVLEIISGSLMGVWMQKIQVDRSSTRPLTSSTVPSAARAAPCTCVRSPSTSSGNDRG